MQSKASSVDQYLAELPADRLEQLTAVRALCAAHLPDHEETMEYGMPVYRRNGKAEFAWASQARYISLYVMKLGVIEANAELLRDLNVGQGCIRLAPSRQLDTDLIELLLTATASSPEPPC